MKIKIKLVILLIVSLILVPSCSSGPSDSEIKQAITESLWKSVPSDNATGLKGCVNANLDFIDIMQIGDYNDLSRYYPVRARVKGVGTTVTFSGQTPVEFDRIIEFRVIKDDYGKWVAIVGKMIKYTNY